MEWKQRNNYIYEHKSKKKDKVTTKTLYIVFKTKGPHFDA